MTQNKLQNDPFLKDKDNEMKRSAVGESVTPR